jgi:hypothetical protein
MHTFIDCIEKEHFALFCCSLTYVKMKHFLETMLLLRVPIEQKSVALVSSGHFYRLY